MNTKGDKRDDTSTKILEIASFMDDKGWLGNEDDDKDVQEPAKKKSKSSTLFIVRKKQIIQSIWPNFPDLKGVVMKPADANRKYSLANGQLKEWKKKAVKEKWFEIPERFLHVKELSNELKHYYKCGNLKGPKSENVIPESIRDRLRKAYFDVCGNEADIKLGARKQSMMETVQQYIAEENSARIARNAERAQQNAWQFRRYMQKEITEGRLRNLWQVREKLITAHGSFQFINKMQKELELSFGEAHEAVEDPNFNFCFKVYECLDRHDKICLTVMTNICVMTVKKLLS